MLRVISGRVTGGMRSQRGGPSTLDVRTMRCGWQSFVLGAVPVRMIKRKEEAAASSPWAVFSDCFCGEGRREVRMKAGREVLLVETMMP